MRQHVRREALPWQPASPLTECGRPWREVEAHVSRAEWRVIATEWVTLVRSWRKAGVERPPGVKAPDLCVTCWETAARWPTWDRDPTKALLRLIEKPGGRDGEARLNAELWALADMVKDNPLRFAELMAERGYPHLFAAADPEGVTW